MTIYDFSVKAMDGKTVPLSKYKGKVLLIVNTATGCGFTPQYVGLEKLYEKYNSKGFEILDFPCDQFAHQAPGSNEEISSFCVGHFGVKFTQFAKIDVNGSNADPLYEFLKKEKSGILSSAIKWNFTKFLISKDGDIVKRFAPTDTPEKIESFVEKLLAK